MPSPLPKGSWPGPAQPRCESSVRAIERFSPNERARSVTERLSLKAAGSLPRVRSADLPNPWLGEALPRASSCIDALAPNKPQWARSAATRSRLRLGRSPVRSVCTAQTRPRRTPRLASRLASAHQLAGSRPRRRRAVPDDLRPRGDVPRLHPRYLSFGRGRLGTCSRLLSFLAHDPVQGLHLTKLEMIGPLRARRLRLPDCVLRGHRVSLSAPPGAMAWGEKRQSGGRSYVGTGTVPVRRAFNPSLTCSGPALLELRTIALELRGQFFDLRVALLEQRTLLVAGRSPVELGLAMALCGAVVRLRRFAMPPCPIVHRRRVSA